MKLSSILSCLVASCVLQPVAQAAALDVPQSQQYQLGSVLWMQRAPEYALVARSVFRAAQDALPAALAQPGSAAKEQAALPADAPAAVIVDLDETMLDNSAYQAYLVATGRNYQPHTWDEWVAAKGARAVPGAVEFANAVMASPRTTIFYVSNRSCPGAAPCPAKTATMENMRALGFPRADDPSAFRFKGERPDSRGDKVGRRTEIGSQYRIVMLVGDDMRDFLPSEDADLLAKGDPAVTEGALRLIGRRWFVLPNAMYGSWAERLGANVPDLGSHLQTPALPSLALATWNLEWLMTPAAYAELSAHCRAGGNPPSNVRALPCPAPQGKPIAGRTQADFDALAEAAGKLQADVVALQEVDGPDAARLVFRKGWALDCFTDRAHPQKVGFAIRNGTPYRCNGDYTALDVDGALRAGADVTLYPGTPQAVRLLAVHLKSGCTKGPLDSSKNPSCAALRKQVPVLERWIDARATDGVPYAVLGDFNRWLDEDAKYGAGPDEKAPTSMFQALDNGQPGGTRLVRVTSGQAPVKCWPDDPYANAPIDNILLSSRLLGDQGIEVARIAYDRKLSDHCPLQARLILGRK